MSEKFSDKADQAFFEQSRKLSPKFPDALTYLERRQRDRENFAARFLLWFLAPAGLITLFWSTFGWVMFGAGILGFVIVCYVAGARAHERAGSPTNGLF